MERKKGIGDVFNELINLGQEIAKKGDADLERGTEKPAEKVNAMLPAEDLENPSAETDTTAGQDEPAPGDGGEKIEAGQGAMVGGAEKSPETEEEILTQLGLKKGKKVTLSEDFWYDPIKGEIGIIQGINERGSLVIYDEENLSLGFIPKKDLTQKKIKEYLITENIETSGEGISEPESSEEGETKTEKGALKDPTMEESQIFEGGLTIQRTEEEKGKAEVNALKDEDVAPETNEPAALFGQGEQAKDDLAAIDNTAPIEPEHKVDKDRIAEIEKEIESLRTDKEKAEAEIGELEAGLEDDDKIQKIRDVVKTLEKTLEKKEIELDREKKLFLYYLAAKTTNNEVIKCNKQDNKIGLVDLRWVNNVSGSGEYKRLQRTRENEGYFIFAVSGFIMVIKNVNEISSEKGIRAMSDKAIYKIIGPDGEVIRDDIVGYNEARGYFNEAVKEYEAKIEKEFNNKTLEEIRTEINSDLLNGTTETNEPAALLGPADNLIDNPAAVTPPEQKIELEDSVILDELNSFGITKEELAKDTNLFRNFSLLTHGQQLLALQNLKQARLGMIEERAQTQYEEETSKMTFAIMVRKWMRGDYEIERDVVKGLKEKWMDTKESAKAAAKSGFKKIALPIIKGKEAEKTKGGLAMFGEDLSLIVKQIQDNHIDVSENQRTGKLEINFFSFDKIKDFSGVNDKPGQMLDFQYAIRDLNDASQKLSKMPYEWKVKSAKPSEKRAYKKAGKHYERIKRKFLELAEENNLDLSEAMQFLNQAEYCVYTDQFLNTNPDVENALRKIDSPNFWNKTLTMGRVLTSTVAERGYMAGLGFGARSLAAAAIGTIGLSATSGVVAVGAAGAGIAGVMGAMTARRRGKEMLIEKTKKARRGKEEEKREKEILLIENRIKDLNKELQDYEDEEERDKIKRKIERYEERIEELKTEDLTSTLKYFKDLLDDNELYENYKDNEEKQGREPKSKKEIEDDLKWLRQIKQEGKQIIFEKAGVLNESLADLIEEIKNADFETDKKARDAIKSLNRLCEYAEAALAEGLIDFGEITERTKNKYDLMRNLAEAKAFSGYFNEEKQKDIEERLNEIFGERKEVISETEKRFLRKRMLLGGLMSAAFFEGGYYIRHRFWEQNAGAGHEKPSLEKGKDGRVPPTEESGDTKKIPDELLENINKKLEDLMDDVNEGLEELTKEGEKTSWNIPLITANEASAGQYIDYYKTLQGANKERFNNILDHIGQEERKQLIISAIKNKPSGMSDKEAGMEAVLKRTSDIYKSSETAPSPIVEHANAPEATSKLSTPTHSPKPASESIPESKTEKTNIPKTPYKFGSEETITRHPPKYDDYYNGQKTPLPQEAALTNTPSSVHSGSHGDISTEFSLKLGEKGVPKNLETVFSAISANHMTFPANGIVNVNDEVAAKILNMGANLVKLAEGHSSVAGITHDEWIKAGDFSGGKLEIKDHNAFNKILEKLQARADENWTKGILQGKGAARDYVSNISRDRWLNEIIHADKLDKTPEGLNTGIIGHDEVTEKQIQDFGPRKVTEIHHSGHHTADELKKQIHKTLETPPEGRRGQLIIDKNPTKKILKEPIFSAEKSEIKQAKQAYEGTKNMLPNAGNAGSEAYPDDRFPDLTHEQNGMLKYNSEFAQNPLNLSGPELIQALEAGHRNTIELFQGDSSVWNILRTTKAGKTLEYTGNNPTVDRLSQYLNALKDFTGLKPKSGLIWTGIRAENSESYLARAFQKLIQDGRLEEFEEKLEILKSK